MKKVKTVFLSVCIFLFLYVIFSYTFQTRGEIINNWVSESSFGYEDITIPYSKDILDPGIYTFSGEFYKNDKATLVIPRVFGYAFKVYINNQFVGQIGDFTKPTTNLWNKVHYFSVTDIPQKDVNEIQIIVYGLHDVGIVFNPYFANLSEISFIIDFQDFFTTGIPIFMMGSLSMFIILLLSLARKSTKNKKMYIFYAMANIFYLIYNFEYIYRVSTMSIESFLVLRKIFIICLYLSSLFFLKGTNAYINKKKIPVSIYGGLIISISFFIFAPTVYWLKIFIDAFNILLIAFIIYIMWLGFKKQEANMYFGSTFFSLSMIHTILINMFKLPQIYSLNFGVFIFFSSLSFTIVIEFSNLESQLEVLDNIAKHDQLTGVYNRTALESFKYNNNDIIMFIDINCFKQINDTFGHEKGDEVLKIVADIINLNIRDKDFCIRYGGDEFIVVFKESTIEATKKRAKKIADYLLNHKEMIVISYGIQDIQNTIYEAIILADHKMYDMKEKLKKAKKEDLIISDNSQKA